MPSLSYSSDAINTLNRFHQCDRMVFVEGDDDILFWDYLFEKMSTVNVKIEAVGGSLELDKIIEKIISNEVTVIAARDSDYKGLLGENEVHNNVLYTYGYSIENTMLTAATLKTITQISCRNNTLTEEDCKGWLDDFAGELYELVCTDVANYKYSLSTCVLGDNCTRFMKSNRSPYFDGNKIKSHLSDNCKLISRRRRNSIKSIFEENGYVLLDFIKGHFVFSAVIKFINNKAKGFGRNVSVSSEQLYSNILQAFQHGFTNEHPHYDFYYDEINAVEA